MSVPKVMRGARPVEFHGYGAVLAEFVDTYGRPAPRAALWLARNFVRGCGDCQADTLYRARLARMRTAYGRRRR